MKTDQKMDYPQKDKVGSFLYREMNQAKDENRHQKMKSKEFS